MTASVTAPQLDSLYQRYGPMVLRRCKALLQDEGQAEDAMQDVFVRLLQRREPLHAGGLSSLLFQMATQVCLNRLRSRRRRPEEASDEVLWAIAVDDDLERRVGGRGLLGLLFGTEPVSTQVMAVMHLYDGMTLEEVAEATGLSVSGVRKRLRNLREKLQTLDPSGSQS